LVIAGNCEGNVDFREVIKVIRAESFFGVKIVNARGCDEASAVKTANARDCEKVIKPQRSWLELVIAMSCDGKGNIARSGEG
jgi:hypothetical protein